MFSLMFRLRRDLVRMVKVDMITKHFPFEFPDVKRYRAAPAPSICDCVDVPSGVICHIQQYTAAGRKRLVELVTKCLYLLSQLLFSKE